MELSFYNLIFFKQIHFTDALKLTTILHNLFRNSTYSFQFQQYNSANPMDNSEDPSCRPV